MTLSKNWRNMQTQILDKNVLPKYVLQGRLDCFRSCSIFSPLQGAAFHSSNDGTFYYSSGIDFAPCNGIISDQKEISDKEIESGLEFFQTRKLPFIWWTSQNLEAKGFQPGGILTGIGLDISHEFPSSNEVSSVKIRPIEGPEELNTFSRMIIHAFGMNPNVIGQYQAVYGAAMHHKEQIHYLAFHEGIPVGTITLSTSDTSGIWNLCVDQEHQNKGIGAALITAALAEAKKLHYDQVMAILMPKGMAWSSFTKLGFKKVCEFPFYLHGASGALER
jgi:GNAT superfamily N-acetyltransferase